MVCCGRAPEHNADDGKSDEGDDGAGMSLEVSRQSSIAGYQGKGALDDPSLGQDDELGWFGALDDLLGAGCGHDVGYPGSLF